jgi:hypothetical protein
MVIIEKGAIVAETKSETTETAGIMNTEKEVAIQQS